MCINESDCLDVIDGNECVQKCSNEDSMIYLSPASGASYCIAKEQCSAYYEGSDRCQDACDPSDGYYLEGTIRKCVKDCGTGMTISNSQLCVSVAHNKAIKITTLTTVLVVVAIIGVSLLIIFLKRQKVKTTLAKSVSNGVQLVNS